MNQALRAPLEIFRHTIHDWVEDEAPRLAAALSFYAVVSVAPLLLIVITVVSVAFGEAAARGAILETLTEFIGNDSAATVSAMVAGAAEHRSGTLGTALGIGVLLFGATAVFAELQSAMNAVWDVETKPGRGVFDYLRRRFLSLVMLLGIALLLIVSLAVTAVLSMVGGVLVAKVPGGLLLWQVIAHGVSFLVTTLLFAMVFKVLPDVKIRFRDVWVGALFTSALFLIGKLLVGIYLARADVASAYGAAGSLLVMLLWIYYSAQIFFFGAEFTQAYARQHGARWEPTANAVPTTA